MDGYRVSEAARQSGLSASAPRFHEREGIVVPVRTESGYRCYAERDVESPRFVRDAKALGLRAGRDRPAR